MPKPIDIGDSPLRVAITPAEENRKLNELVERNASHSIVPRIGQLADMHTAEIALYPYVLAQELEEDGGIERIRAIVEANGLNGLKTVLLLRHDHFKPLQIGQPDAVVLRDSMVGALHYEGEYPIPGAVNTKGLVKGMHPIREYSTTPTVGFMGSVAMTSLPAFVAKHPNHPPVGFTAVDVKLSGSFPQPLNIGALIRRQALDALARSTAVQPLIVEREGYHGMLPEHDRQQHRAEYLDHFAKCDYIVCIRGAGNFSHRLYETLAMGRIPIIVDTDMVMPCADQIDWNKIGVWVPLQQIDSIAEIAAAFHIRLTPEKFREMQVHAQASYWNVLDRVPFRKYLEESLIKIVRA